MRLTILISSIFILFSANVKANYFYCDLGNESETIIFEVSKNSVDAIKLIQRNKITKSEKIEIFFGGEITYKDKTTLIWHSKGKETFTLDRVSGILIVTYEGSSNIVKWLCYKGKDL